MWRLQGKIQRKSGIKYVLSWNDEVFDKAWVYCIVLAAPYSIEMISNNCIPSIENNPILFAYYSSFIL